MPKYWVVGAMLGGEKERDQLDLFFRRGYWLLGYADKDQPDQAKRRDQIEPGDRIAVKKMLGRGSHNIEIRAIGIVKEIDSHDKRVYVDWILRDVERIVPAKGAFKAIHGPFDPKDAWTNEVFRI
jgi:hypothetical protein